MNGISAVQIKLASPEKIRSWTNGIVINSDTINYKTLKPANGGLFCEQIFGPVTSFLCACGKYKGTANKGIICPFCGVELTTNFVRRLRFGRIELAAPVAHIWFVKGIPSRIGLLLNMGLKDIEKIVYYSSYIVTDAGTSPLKYKQLLDERSYKNNILKYGNSFTAQTGAEALKKLLSDIDLNKESKKMSEDVNTLSGIKKEKLLKRIEIINGLISSNSRPEWMIMSVIPVLPPDLRPIVSLDGVRFACSDLNELYRTVINRNNRLLHFMEVNAPEVILKNEKRLLQEAVDSLIDNGRHGKAITGSNGKQLRSISSALRGKQGYFRKNLLGKRVDYSGRSVIVVGPELKLHQCGLPKEMALELFKPFVMKELVSKNIAYNIKSAKNMIERMDIHVWDALDTVIKNRVVLLNRAPTLHRLGIQAFEPILVSGKAIKLHPLVCTAFNADFDGDQMAVHLPLSSLTQYEARSLLLSSKNLLKPSDGSPVAIPSQDIVLGIYYLTQERKDGTGAGKCFKSVNEALLAYENNVISLHSPIKVRIVKNIDGQNVNKIISSTIGRFIFNEIIPQDLGFINRTLSENLFKLEINFQVGKKEIKQILDNTIEKHGIELTAVMLDKIKTLGFKYSTKAGMTVSISDMSVPKEKSSLINNAQSNVNKITNNYKRGLITNDERYKEVIGIWKTTDDNITAALLNGLSKYNNLFMMADSGARGSDKQIKQLAGMRGLMADATGRTIELPIKSNFREGLDVLEYFISAHGARKGLSDTALRTADSGYLTRRLVDVSQDINIREIDCAEHNNNIPGIYVKEFVEGNEIIESLEERIIGRYLAKNLIAPDGKIIFDANTLITKDDAKLISSQPELYNNTGIKIRSAITCKSKIGICSKCYGTDLANGKPVDLGINVGIIAAQSIGEPGTQLTMRTFHTGGVAGDDITQGLPRIEELFEARKPKRASIISYGSGIVRHNNKEIEVIDTDTNNSTIYPIPYGYRIIVNNGESVKAGTQLTDGRVSPKELLNVMGIAATYNYILKEVQKVYRLQGVEINDKHIEIIIRQMLRNVKITNAGNSNFVVGSLVNRSDFYNQNNILLNNDAILAEAEDILLGITRSSLTTTSFLAAASFQETTKVLSDAAIKGRIDNLINIKENVLVGNLIPSTSSLPDDCTLDNNYKIYNQRNDNTYDKDNTFLMPKTVLNNHVSDFNVINNSFTDTSFSHKNAQVEFYEVVELSESLAIV